MKNLLKKTLGLALVLCPLGLVACAPSAKLTAPAGFAHVEGDYDDRITSARGVVVAARVEKNDPKANLDFWVEAIDLRLQKRGYVTSSAPIATKTKAGLSGKALRYDYAGKKYWVDVYVTDKSVVLVEATGRAQDLIANSRDVESAMRDVRLD